MVDIHSHILHLVDDGSDSLENSIEMLKNCSCQGVKEIILTPHYKSGSFMPSIHLIKEKFEELKSQIQKENLDVKIYLGQELYCDENIYDRLKNKEVLTLNQSKYVLVEFDFFDYVDILEYVYNLTNLGYVTIIAHIERYTYLDWRIIIELKDLGALIQTNVECVLGNAGKAIQKKVLKAIKEGLIDFVASDTHYTRQKDFIKAYSKVVKTCGEEIANKVFYENAKKYFI